MKKYGFVNAFIGDRRKEGKYPEECLFLLFRIQKNSEELADMMRNLEGFKDEYDPDDDHIVFVVEIEDKWKKLYHLFKEGQYSQFDEAYIKQFYPRRVYAGIDAYGKPLSKDSINYLILTRDPELKHEIEEDLGVTLRDYYDHNLGKQVYYQLHSKPNLEDELL
jgi:superfamily I DNA/RNA helicase